MAGIGALGFGLALLWAAPSPAQEGQPPGKARAVEPAPGAPFIDRDGDGVHDGMQHRFRRHKRAHGKRHGEGRGRDEERPQRQEKASG